VPPLLALLDWLRSVAPTLQYVTNKECNAFPRERQKHIQQSQQTPPKGSRKGEHGANRAGNRQKDPMPVSDS
jgi:hypothetical protein